MLLCDWNGGYIEYCHCSDSVFFNNVFWGIPDTQEAVSIKCPIDTKLCNIGNASCNYSKY